MREVPQELQHILTRRLGDDAPGVVAEMNMMLRELQAGQGKARSGPASGTVPQGEKTRSSDVAPEGWSPFSITPLGAFNPSVISIDTMDEMMRDGLVSFILDIRSMPIIALFRAEPGDGWDVECDNKELEEICRRALVRIMHRLVKEAQTARAYGFLCAEKVFELVTYEQLGVSEEFLQQVEATYDPNKTAWVYQTVKGNAPTTIEQILRDERTDAFMGYVQGPRGGGSGPAKVRVPADKAFVFSYRKVFGNLYGDPLLSKMYTPWWWLQFTWRSLLRYLDRMGTPVAVCKAPSDEKLQESDGGEKMALDHALQVAIDVGKSNAAAIPSDKYAAEEGGGDKWELTYLTDDQRAGQMVDVKRDLETWLFYAASVPPKVIGMSPGETGAYAAWRVTQDVFMLAEEQDLAEFEQHVNDYLLPQLGQYNAGAEYGLKGKVRMFTMGLDASEGEQALQIAEKAIQYGHPDSGQLDLLALFERAGMPIKESEHGEASDSESEAITGPSTTEEERDDQPAEDVQGGFRAVPMNTDEVILLLAHRELRDTGRIAIRAGSMKEAKAKATVLRGLGFDQSVPIEVQAL